MPVKDWSAKVLKQDANLEEKNIHCICVTTVQDHRQLGQKAPTGIHMTIFFLGPWVRPEKN